MEVKLFKLGGHEYVFHFGITRKGKEQQKNTTKRYYAKRNFVTIPKNKYGYSRDDVSRHIGLKKYSEYMEKISEILDKIPEISTKTASVVDKLKDVIPNMEPCHLNMIARVHENNPLQDSQKQKWLLVSNSWGNSSEIYKKKYVEEKK